MHELLLDVFIGGGAAAVVSLEREVKVEEKPQSVALMETNADDTDRNASPLFEDKYSPTDPNRAPVK